MRQLHDDSVNDNLYVCANGINDGKYAYNNLQQYDATWYHKFSKTWHMATETWYMYERDVPALGGTIQPEAGANPAYCLPGEQRCTAPEYAVVNFLQKELSVHDFLSFRSDYLDDKKGQRTGYATRYSENTITWCHWIGTTIQIRPELRFERAWDHEGLRLRAAAESVDGGERSDFSFLNCVFLGRPRRKMDS